MPAIDRVRIARETYGAYESGNREMVEKHLSPEFRFYSPADVGIDLSTYWTRCWPNAEMIAAFDFKRIIDRGDEVMVTYEATKTDGKRFRKHRDPHLRWREDRGGGGVLRMEPGLSRWPS
jgi:hypothetical protein